MALSDFLYEYRLPSLPRAGLRILELCQDPNVDLQELRKAIEREPALSSRVVRVANSSLFGLSREISSIDQAVIMLGLRTVKLTVLTTTLFEALPFASRSANLATCWRRILANAFGARLLAPALGLDPEEAYLAGMMQDIGILVLAISLNEKYLRLLDQSTQEGAHRLCELEQHVLSFTHAQLGGRLLEEWRFPAHITKAVARHHDAEPVPAENLELHQLLSFVERITEWMLHPSTRDEQWIDSVVMPLSLSGWTIQKFVHRVDAELKSMNDMFELRLPNDRRSEQLLQEMREIAHVIGIQPALLDPQTGILHRNAVAHRLRQELSVGRRKRWFVSILLVRIAPLTRLFEAGRMEDAKRRVLEITGGLQRVVRDSDSLFRFASDTYCLLAGDTNGDGLRRLIERLHPTFIADDDNIHTKIDHDVAYGAVTVPPGDQPADPDLVLERAMANLEVAPSQGGILATGF